LEGRKRSLFSKKNTSSSNDFDSFSFTFITRSPKTKKSWKTLELTNQKFRSHHRIEFLSLELPRAKNRAHLTQERAKVVSDFVAENIKDVKRREDETCNSMQRRQSGSLVI
jgi:hypothetical protein